MASFFPVFKRFIYLFSYFVCSFTYIKKVRENQSIGVSIAKCLQRREVDEDHPGIQILSLSLSHGWQRTNLLGHHPLPPSMYHIQKWESGMGLGLDYTTRLAIPGSTSTVSQNAVPFQFLKSQNYLIF